MKMLDVVLPDSHETVDLCDGNADQGLFLVFSKKWRFYRSNIVRFGL